MSFDLRLGDCLDPLTGLASLADRSVDVCLTDAPYSPALYERFRSNRRATTVMDSDGNRSARRSDAYRALAAGEIGASDEALVSAVAPHLVRVTQRWIVVFGDEDSAILWRHHLRLAGAGGVRWGVAVKVCPMPQVSADRPAQGIEHVIVAHAPRASGSMRWNGGGRPATWRYPAVHADDHPCPKPLETMEALVRDFTDPGELVLDPFAGSGTTGVACLRNGRRFIGWERNETWHAAAVKRLANTREQPSLFAPADPMPRRAKTAPLDLGIYSTSRQKTRVTSETPDGTVTKLVGEE